MSHLRTITVEHTDFEWKCGRRFVRIRGNGHVADVPLEKFIVEVSEGTVNEREAIAQVNYEGGKHVFGIEPSDVVRYIHKHGWLTEKTT